MNDIYAEVDFAMYCETCEYCDRPEKCDPCNDCLAMPMNTNSSRPIYWKEKTDDSKGAKKA